MKKIALFSDVHGNIEALDAVLVDIKNNDIKRVICLGDVASYNANQHACMQRLQDHNIEWIAGNHDLMAAGILEPLACSPYALCSSIRARKRLKPKWRDFIRQLPLMIVEDQFCAFHASPEKVDEYLISEQRVRRAADIIRERELPAVAFFGHTHQCRVHQLKQDQLNQSSDCEVKIDPEAIYLINVGTVGEPRGKDKHAHYVTFDPDARSVKFHTIAYDHDTSWQRSIEQGWRQRPGDRAAELYYKFRREAEHLRHKLFPRKEDDSRLAMINERKDSA